MNAREVTNDVSGGRVVADVVIGFLYNHVMSGSQYYYKKTRYVVVKVEGTYPVFRIKYTAAGGNTATKLSSRFPDLYRQDASKFSAA